MTIAELQKQCHATAVAKGFWDTERNNGEMLALMHSEISETLEELRNKEVNWEKVAEELADVLIRLFDFAEGRHLNLTKALEKKMEVNQQRPYKHGRGF